MISFAIQRGFPGGTVAKNLSVSGMQETQVQSPCHEDPLKQEMATHSIIVAWKVPWTEELGRLQSTGSQSQT